MWGVFWRFAPQHPPLSSSSTPNPQEPKYSNRWKWGQALWVLLLLLGTACQPRPTAVVPSPTLEATATLAATLPPVFTPTPANTPTAEIPEILRFQPTELKGQKVLFWHPMVGESAVKLEALVKQFNSRNEWGLQVVIAAQGGSGAMAETVAQASSADLPDVVLAPSEQLAAWHQDRKLLEDLNPYILLPEWGLAKAEREAFLPIFWKQDQFRPEDGQDNPVLQLGIPAFRSASGLIYNRTFAAELGFKRAPVTPAELFEQACAAAKLNNRSRDSMGTGGWMIDNSSLSALSWMAAFGADPAPATSAGAWQFDQPNALEAFRYLRGMQEKGCLWVPKHPIPYDYFGDRKALFYSASLQELPLQASYQTKIGSGDDWTMIPFPGVDGKPVAFAYGSSYAVLQAHPASRQMAAWLFVRWMSQAANQAELARAWDSFPVSSAAGLQLKADAGRFPRNLILALEPALRPAPSEASWRLVRRPLEDAFWQLFNLASADQVATLLPALDQMAAEMIQGQK